MIGRIWALASLAVVSLLIGVPTASGSVTLGQMPSTSMADCGGGPVDLITPTVTSGNSYAAPSDGTITSWSTHGSTAPGAGTAKLKVFRKIADPATYQVVAQDNFRTISQSVVNTFNVTLGGIQAGDVIGLDFTGHTGCQFPVPGGTFLTHGGTGGDIPTGGQGDFMVNTGFQVDVSAAFDPSHKFTLGAVTRNKKRGTATLGGTFPGPGQVVLSGKGVKGAGTPIQVAAKGDVALPIKAAGAKRHTLFDTGKVTLNVSAVYTPTGGSAGSAATKVKLKKKV
jgi:hypothetical protein